MVERFSDEDRLLLGLQKKEEKSPLQDLALWSCGLALFILVVYLASVYYGFDLVDFFEDFEMVD